MVLGTKDPLVIGDPVVSVTTGAGLTASMDKVLAYDLTPMATSLSPANGPVTGGATVYVLGSDLRQPEPGSFDGLSVEIGSVAAATWVSSTAISFVLPAGSGRHTPRLTDVAVADEEALEFVFDAAAVQAAKPDNLAHEGGQTITLVGMNFGSTMSADLQASHRCHSSMYPCLYHISVHMFVHMCVRVCLHMSVPMHTHKSLHMSVHLCVHIFALGSTHTSVYTPVRMSACLCMHMCVPMCSRVYTHVSIPVYAHDCLDTCLVCTNVYTHVCMHVCTHSKACLYACLHTCLYACLCTCLYACPYTG